MRLPFFCIAVFPFIYFPAKWMADRLDVHVLWDGSPWMQLYAGLYTVGAVLTSAFILILVALAIQALLDFFRKRRSDL